MSERADRRPMTESDESYPLAGVRVLDLTRVVAGPYCTRLLSDLGAEVYKIEPPTADMARAMGDRRHGLSGLFTQHNVGKNCLCIDLDKPGGIELMLELVPEVDVLVDNFRPGVMERIGMGEQVLRARNPRLIHCQISGFGHDSPSSDRRAFAGVVHAMSGVLESQARADERGATDLAHAYADTATGVHACNAIVAALFMRERTGRGQTIDMAMHDVMMSINESCGEHLFESPRAMEHHFRGTLLPCKQGAIVYAGDPIYQFERFVEAIERADLLDDPRLSTSRSRTDHRQVLIDALGDWAAQQPDAVAASERLESFGQPAGEVRTIPEALRSPEVTGRGMLVDVDDRAGGRVPVLNTPYFFSAASSGARGHARYRGEDNRRVLGELLGYDDARLDELEQAAIVIKTAKKRDKPAAS